MRFLTFFLFLPLIGFAQVAKPPLLELSGGVFEIVRHNRHMTGEFVIEYKFSCEWYTIRPIVGFMVTCKNSTYLYTGLAFDWILGGHLLLSPDFAAGWYSPNGGKNLGFPLEFRSGINLGWVFNSGYRVGSHFYHISNASLGHKNPGEESLDLFLAIPF